MPYVINGRTNMTKCVHADSDFLDKLEELIFTINLDEPLLIIGDMNMDLLTAKGDELANFISNNEFTNSVFEPTRIATRYMQQQN